MLSPIPSRILQHTITLHVTTAVDAWQNPTVKDYEVKHVCVQPTHETRMNRDNTEVALRSLLFVDAHRSTPRLDWEALQEESLAAGSAMTLTYNGRHYTVMAVDALIDDTGRLHHYEVALL
jgi:hypothetical protein